MYHVTQKKNQSTMVSPRKQMAMSKEGQQMKKDKMSMAKKAMKKSEMDVNKPHTA